jgi:hypothetical protein
VLVLLLLLGHCQMGQHLLLPLPLLLQQQQQQQQQQGWPGLAVVALVLLPQVGKLSEGS